MSETRCDIGVVGMGVMGRAILMNIADRGYKAAAFTRDSAKARTLREDTNSKSICIVNDAAQFIRMLEPPRPVLILVPAGRPVDETIEMLLPHLESGDLLIDGGNSHFEDTRRRAKALLMRKIAYIGLGISGGQSGARYGPCLMVGGDADAYRRIQPILEAIAARVHGEPCVALLGPCPAGHYVKMVHNGIEYGLMQLIAECCHLLKTGRGLSWDELADICSAWNQGALASYLMEITAQLLKKKDSATGLYLVDLIRDRAHQKGTGLWTVKDAFDLSMPIPTITSAVEVRHFSLHEDERAIASRILSFQHDSSADTHSRSLTVKDVERGLLAAMIVTYAQGMALLRAGYRNYFACDAPLEQVARIWRGGCIIRAAVLEDIRNAFCQDPLLANVLLHGPVARKVMETQHHLRIIVSWAIEHAIATPALGASLWYLDNLRSDRLPTYLVQAQRDYFGSHTYERIDMPGSFHTEWEEH